MEITVWLRFTAFAALVAWFFFLLRERKLLSCEWLRGQFRYLRAAWPADANWTSDQLHVFASRDLQAELWEGVATQTMPSWTNETSFCLPFDGVLGGRYGSMFFRLGLGGDTDGDGLDDVVELRVAGTDPALADTDGDGLSDGWEWEHRQEGVNPLLYDSDGDGVNDGDEIAAGIRPDCGDTDGDGLPDGAEAAWIEEGAEIPWFDISNGTALVQSQEVDSALYTVALPTSVHLAGSRVTHLVVDANGIVYFGDSSVTGSVESSDWAIDTSFDIDCGMVAVAACSTDLCLRPSRNSAITFAEVTRGGVTYAVVEFSRVGSYYGDWGDEVSFQVSMPLDSASGVVHVRYGDMSVSPGCYVGVGAQGACGFPKLPYWYNDHFPATAGDVVSFHFGCGADPLLADTDGDGLGDGREVLEGTNPHDPDTDGDGLFDGWEVDGGLDPLLAVGDDGADGDPDHDGLFNLDEYAFGANPLMGDTDEDGLGDLREVGGFVATNASWLTLSSVTNLTAAFDDEDSSVAVWELPSPVTVQGVCVSNVSIDVNGVVFFNQGGYCLMYGVGSGAMLVESWTICQDAFMVAPYWSDLVLSSTPPATMVTAGEAMVDGGLHYVIQYENACSYWGDGSVSWQLSFRAGDVREMIIRYSGMSWRMDGRDASIGFQSFDGRRTCSWCYHEPGAVQSGLSLALIVPTDTNPALVDTDCDGIGDFEEVRLGTNPIQPDTDGDGLTDGWEFAHSAPTNSTWVVFDPLVHNGEDDDGRNDANADPDGDGLSNADECMWGTNPWSVDTDGDGATDGEETGEVPRQGEGTGAGSGDGGGGGTPGFSDPADPSDGGVPGSRVKATFRFGDDSGSHSEKYRLDLRCVAGDGQSYGRVNLNYGVCEEQSVALKPGCSYEVRLFHAGTDPLSSGYGYPDYDYLLELRNPLSLLLVDDPYGLFGVDYTSDFFAGEGKVATLRVPALEFVMPAGNPVTEPRSGAGDGQNEFTYDDATSSLTMLLKVRVTPSSDEIAGRQGRFSLPAIPGAMLEWENGSDGFAEAVGGEFTARATYRGYPTHNSGFGRKTVHFTIDGRTISQDFEVFFPSDGTHHPACTTCSNCPNWFYYWRDGGVCGITDDIVYGTSNTSLAGEFVPTQNLIRLHAGAPLQSSSKEGRIYEYIVETNVVEGLDDPIVMTNKTEVGRLPIGVDAAGIRAVAATVKHERRHREIYQVLTGNGIPGDAPVPFDLDDDLDLVLDSDEIAGRWGIVTDPNCPDTFEMWRISSQYESYGDNEVRARIAEGEGIQESYNIGNDWCDPGCQSMVIRGPLRDESRGDGQ